LGVTGLESRFSILVQEDVLFAGYDRLPVHMQMAAGKSIFSGAISFAFCAETMVVNKYIFVGC
jgi:hypothetical protein